MGWYFTNGGTKQDLINELREPRKLTRPDGMVVMTISLANCYRGNLYSGVLWSVFERRFFKDGKETGSVQRWIGCDIIQFNKGDWGYKPLSELMGPYYYSVPLGYLKMVPIEIYGGNFEWRQKVADHHAQQHLKRAAKRLNQN